jgi:uncharacterized protein (TIGR00369 family)
VRLLDHFHAMIRGEAPAPPISELLGFRMTEAAEGRVVMEMEIEERHTSPPGSAHGGVLCDIADAAMGCAFGTLFDADTPWATVELKINYLRPAWPGMHLVAEGRVVNAGRTLGLTQCDVRDGDGKLLAHATSTCMRLDAPPAAR